MWRKSGIRVWTSFFPEIRGTVIGQTPPDDALLEIMVLISFSVFKDNIDVSCTSILFRFVDFSFLRSKMSTYWQRDNVVSMLFLRRKRNQQLIKLHVMTQQDNLVSKSFSRKKRKNGTNNWSKSTYYAANHLSVNASPKEKKRTNNWSKFTLKWHSKLIKFQGLS